MPMNTAGSADSSRLLTVSTLILIAFATAFFPRILGSIGVPVLINFVHFAVVPIACGAVVLKSRIKNRKQISIVAELALGLLLLLSVTLVSALINHAGAINVFFSFLLLTEGFIFLVAIVCIPLTFEAFQRYRAWILKFFLIHLALAFVQTALLYTGILHNPKMTLEDNVQGVFYLSGGGHVVAASVSIFAGLYYLVSARSVALWLRAAVFFAAFMEILFADAKQVLLVALLGWLLLIASRLKNIKRTLQYVGAAIIVGFVLVWCVENVEIFQAYTVWIRPEIYGPDGDATILKMGPLRIIPAHYTTPLNWLFGLGPGHTIGRLGGWMIRDYWSLLGRLGATSNPVGNEIWETWDSSYLGSSMFSPFWGFAGIWGDLGFLGVAAYLYIWSIVWRRLCPNDFSRFIVFNVLLNGLIFTLLEEPGFMLSATALIGLSWQERQLAEQWQQQRQYQAMLIEHQAELN